MPEDDEFEEPTSAEGKRYERAYRETRRALDEAIDLLLQFAHFSDDEREQSDLEDAVKDLRQQRRDLVKAHLAFHQGRAEMMPPSAALVQEIVDLSKEVVDLTVERTTASAVVQIATSAFNKFAEIQAL
jgi:hypothetical protein